MDLDLVLLLSTILSAIGARKYWRGAEENLQMRLGLYSNRLTGCYDLLRGPSVFQVFFLSFLVCEPVGVVISPGSWFLAAPGLYQLIIVPSLPTCLSSSHQIAACVLFKPLIIWLLFHSSVSCTSAYTSTTYCQASVICASSCSPVLTCDSSASGSLLASLPSICLLPNICQASYHSSLTMPSPLHSFHPLCSAPSTSTSSYRWVWVRRLSSVHKPYQWFVQWAVGLSCVSSHIKVYWCPPASDIRKVERSAAYTICNLIICNYLI